MGYLAYLTPYFDVHPELKLTQTDLQLYPAFNELCL